MSSNQILRAQIVDLISEEVGMLGELIFDEVLAGLDIDIDEATLSRHLAGKFVRLLDEKLPGDMANRQQVIRDVGNLLINTP